MPEPKGEGALDLQSRLALRPKEAAAALGVSERKLRQMLPDLPHVHECGVVLIPVDLLREWLRERVEAEQAKEKVAVQKVIQQLA